MNKNKAKKIAKKQKPGMIPRPKIQIRGNEVTPFIESTAPQFVNAGPGVVRIQNREIVLTVTGTATTGTIAAGSLVSPVGFQGATWMFGSTPNPWLRGIGLNYDKWRVVSMQFMFQPLYPVTTGGAIAMYFDPDTSDTQASNYISVAGNFRASTGSVFEPVKMSLVREQTNRLPQYLVNSTAGAPPGTLTAPGQFVIAWSDIVTTNATLTGAQTFGYVWAEYSIEFSMPTKTVT